MSPAHYPMATLKTSAHYPQTASTETKPTSTTSRLSSSQAQYILRQPQVINNAKDMYEQLELALQDTHNIINLTDVEKHIICSFAAQVLATTQAANHTGTSSYFPRKNFKQSDTLLWPVITLPRSLLFDFTKKSVSIFASRNIDGSTTTIENNRFRKASTAITLFSTTKGWTALKAVKVIYRDQKTSKHTQTNNQQNQKNTPLHEYPLVNRPYTFPNPKGVSKTIYIQTSADDAIHPQGKIWEDLQAFPPLESSLPPSGKKQTTTNGYVKDC